MTWQLGAALNAVIGISYLGISWVIYRGLWRTRQLRTNVLATATGTIFFTCAVHHGGHALHVLLPIVGLDRAGGEAMRHAFTWQMDVWDVFGALAAVFYLGLRRNYGVLLHQPALFEDEERAAYEVRLERERSFLADAQAIAKLGSWVFHPNDGRLEWSDGMWTVFDLDRNEPPSAAGIYRDMTPEDAERTSRTFAEAIAAGREVMLEVTVRPRHGAPRELHFIGHPDAAGYYFGTVQDVTEQRRAEEALTEMEQRLRTTVSHAPIGMSVVDLADPSRGRLLSANEALADLLGYPPDELCEMSLLSVVHPDDAAAVSRDLAVLATDDHARVQLEVRLLHGQGQIVWAVLSGATVPADGAMAAHAVFHFMDIGERKRFEGQLQYLADHDALTGLFNRRRFEEELVRTLAHSARYGSIGAVLMIDLDGFKVVNDLLGHSHGDELVRRCGGLLRETLRETDTLARLGGDEFAVILPEADGTEAMTIAEKLLDVLRERAVVLTETKHARVSASIGVTTFGNAGRITAEELIVEADIAMYEAKERGKNQAALYTRTPTPQSRLVERQSWLERLRNAGTDGRFELMAQRMVPLSGDLAEIGPHFELLLRLRGDNGELIPPGTFLHIAERFDLIQQIDRWVLEQAVEMLRVHAERGQRLTLSVNMSGKTVSDPKLLGDLDALLVARPVPEGQRLIVEVTETAAIVNIEKARMVARRLGELGCSFALDDFGAGFASFYYLKHLEFDYLKIDGEFIKSLIHHRPDQLVVRAVVDIAKGLGAETVAEYVGDEETLTWLTEQGVDFGQGYYLGRPAPVDLVLPAAERR